MNGGNEPWIDGFTSEWFELLAQFLPPTFRERTDRLRNVDRRQGDAGSQESFQFNDLDGNCAEISDRSEEHTSDLQSRAQLVCRLGHEKKIKVKPEEHTFALVSRGEVV